MMFARILLWINAVVFLGLGVYAIVDPQDFTEVVSFGLLNGNSYVETLAMYGGLEIGFALFFAFCAWHPDRIEAGLLASAFIFLGLGGGRLLGIFLYEASDLNFMLQLLASEVLFVVLSLAALRNYKKTA